VSVEDEDLGGEGAAETSLRDDLASALTEVKAREEGAGDDGDHDSTTVADAAAAGGDTKPAREDGRNDRGQFAGKPKEGEASAAPAPADGAAPAAPADQAAADGPPKSLRQDEAAEWANTPPKVREAFLRREREIATTIGRQDGERLFGKEMADIFRPHAEEITTAGATPQLALKTLLGNHNSLRSGTPQERVATARRLLFEYGIDPSIVARPDPNMPQDPHVQHLMRQVQTLTQQLHGRTAQGDQQQYAPLPAPVTDDNVAPDIEAFRTDPAHPHFDQVVGHMAQLIEAGAAPDLEAAYQMAVSAQPALRSTAPAPEPAPAPAPAPQRSKEVAAARQADVSVTGSPGSAGEPKPVTLRDELRQELRRHQIT
jgi:hypothetical protein